MPQIGLTVYEEYWYYLVLLRLTDRRKLRSSFPCGFRMRM